MPPAGGRGVSKSRNDDAGEGGYDPGKQHPGEARDRAQIAIEQRRDQQAGRGGGKVRVMERGQRGDRRGLQARPEHGQKAGEADAAGGDRKRRGEAELPDVEKAEPVAASLRAINLPEERIGTTGTRKRGAELGPDQPIGNGDSRAQNPRPHREPVAGRGNHQWQRDKGAHPDHLQHVEEHGRAQADAALESGRKLRRVGA